MADRHITIGDLSLRLSIVADALGIPAATLERLASGEWVAVPKPQTRLSIGSPGESQSIKVLTPCTLVVTTYGAPFVLETYQDAATEAGSHDD